MAHNLPVDPPPTGGGPQPHPALCLIVGFGVVFMGAYIVHIVFNVLV